MTAPSLPVRTVDLLERSQVARHYREQEEPVQAIPTPFEAWNRSCRDAGGSEGLALRWHVTVAGATGLGKTLVGLNLGASAIEAGESVGFVSLEMSRAQLETRLHAILTGTDVRDIERGDRFSETVADRVTRDLAEIRERTGAGFHVNDEPIVELEEILGLMAYWRESKGCRFFVIDYLQLCAAHDVETLFQQVSRVSARVRQFAARHQAVTVGLSQLNRTTSSDYTTKPRVQGLMASSSLENDSDQVLLLDHTRYERDEAWHKGRTWALLAKNRHGPQGEIPVCFNYRTLRIREAASSEEDAWP